MPDKPHAHAEDQTSGELRQDRFVGDWHLTHFNTPARQFFARVFQQLSRHLGPHGTLILTFLLGLAVAAVLTAAFALVYEAVVEADGVAGLDQSVLAAAKTLRAS